jgi:hypothetical protein
LLRSICGASLAPKINIFYGDPDVTSGSSPEGSTV